MSRLLPTIFSLHFLPEFFFENPASVLADDGLQEKLQGAWQAGAEDSREIALREAVPKVRFLSWGKARAVLVELVAPQSRGEAQAVILSHRPATGEARIFYLEKTDQGFALTSLDGKRTHRYHHEFGQNSLQLFDSAARSLAEN